MKNRKIYVIGYGIGYASWMGGTLVNNMRDADLVVLTGGEDVDPNMYQETRHPHTSSTPTRDLREHDEYVKAQALNLPVIGICRGLQLICVENGGRLIQHQDNPGTHMIETHDGHKFAMSSLHHQAAYPFELPEDHYHILAWTKGMLKYHQDGDENEMNPPLEVEAIYFPRSNSFGIQGHPEMMNPTSPAVIYWKQVLTNFLDGKILDHVSDITTSEKQTTTKKEISDEEYLEYYAG